MAARSGGLRRLWVFGSFVTDKPGPGDLDLLAVFDAGFSVEALPVQDKHWFDHEICRALYEIDFFWLTQQATDQTLLLILDTFRTNRSGDEAMIEVIL